MSDNPQKRFLAVERVLVEWWAQRPNAEVNCECDEWIVRVDSKRFSISEMALAVANGGG